MSEIICRHRYVVDRCPDCVGEENIRLRKLLAVLVRQRGGLVAISEEVVLHLPYDLNIVQYQDAETRDFVIRATSVSEWPVLRRRRKMCNCPAPIIGSSSCERPCPCECHR